MSSIISSKHKYKYFWMILGVLSFGLDRIMVTAPDWVDMFYFRGIFQGFRWIYDHTLGFLPIPVVYITLVVFVIYTARIFTKMIKNAKDAHWLSGLGEGLLGLLAFFGGSVFFFYLLWGYNYNRSNIYADLDMQEQVIDSIYLMNEIDRVTKELISTRMIVSTDSLNAISEVFIPEDLESQIRDNLEGLLESWDIPTTGRVRVRKLALKGVLLRFSTAGVYVPYVFEGHIDGGLHPILWPFTMAHEMTHGYGYGDEGTCNFIGYLACVQSDNDVIRYSAIRAYWRYLMSDLRKLDKELYRQYMILLPLALKVDLNEIIEYTDRYPDIMPVVRDKMYDSYLKSHGVKDGLANYSHMIKYIKAYRERE